MKLINQFKQGKLIYFNAASDIAVYESSHFRWITAENTCQSIMLLRQPTKLILPHHYALMLPLLFITPESIAMLGLGGGNLNRFLLNINPHIKLLSVEQQPSMVSTYKTFFSPTPLEEEIIIADAIDWLKFQRIQTHWLIWDVFKNKHANGTNQPVFSVLTNLDRDQVLTINIAGESCDTINSTLAFLRAQFHQRDIIYFSIPQYNNIIVHVLPCNFDQQASSLSSWLSKSMYKRWQLLWRYGCQI